MGQKQSHRMCYRSSIRLQGCSRTWVRSPPVSPRYPLWGWASRTAALPAGADETTTGEPPSVQHSHSHSLQRRVGRKNGGNGMNGKRKPQGFTVWVYTSSILTFSLLSTALASSFIEAVTTLTCQLHIVAQLSCDWQFGVELGRPL